MSRKIVKILGLDKYMQPFIRNRLYFSLHVILLMK